MRVGAVLALLAGAWFALGWVAWQPIIGQTYIANGTPLRHFAFAVGLSVGPGVLLIGAGAVVFGYLACAHRVRPLDEMTQSFDDSAYAVAEQPQAPEVVATDPDEATAPATGNNL